MTGVVEIVEHGTSGLLVPPEDHVALADEIERLAHDRELATKLGENARRRIENRFDADRNVLARLKLFGAIPAKTPRLPSEPSLQMSWQES